MLKLPTSIIIRLLHVTRSPNGTCTNFVLSFSNYFFAPKVYNKKNPPDLVLAVLFRRIKSKASKVDWIEFSEGLTAKVQKCKLITVYIVTCTCIIYILEPVYNYMCHNFCIQSLCKDTMSRFCDKTVILVNPVRQCTSALYTCTPGTVHVCEEQRG